MRYFEFQVIILSSFIAMILKGEMYQKVQRSSKIADLTSLARQGKNQLSSDNIGISCLLVLDYVSQ